MRSLHVRRLGLVEYEDGLAAQRLLVAARTAGLVPDTLLLLEHPRAITLGRGAKQQNLLLSKEQLAAEGFELHETDRGGDVTYHGPGQLVGYPILDLKPDRKDVRKYVGSVEELMIRLASDWGVAAERVAGRTGVWVPGAGPGKLGAIGVHIARWVTSHGFAFNVTTRLADFAAIVPCGIADASVTSLQALLGRAPAMPEVEERAIARGAEVWDSEASEVAPELRTISVAVLREGRGGADEVLLLHRIPSRGGFWQILTGRRELEESPLQTAARELQEETGFSPALEDLRDLDYAHSFPIDPLPAFARPPRAPLFAHETAFALRVPYGRDPELDPSEHDGWLWSSVPEALQLLPFAGLRRAVTLATALPR
ncbi:MAG TPA: lipoyl(octanoyl) transferase LipB [Myxococcales bacterium]|jgi:lipoyl(octanoyl) transferase|nr:lipoyl(octanoyl) transferase LipB [Myxococcales bacterium]